MGACKESLYFCFSNFPFAFQLCVPSFDFGKTVFSSLLLAHQISVYRPVSVPAMLAFPVILPSHGRKRKGSCSQPSSSQFSNCDAGRLKVPFGRSPQVVRGAWTLRLYNSYKKPQQELATSIFLILELFFLLFMVQILFRLRTLLPRYRSVG